MEGKGEDELEAQTSLAEESRSREGSNSLARKMSGRRIRNFVRGLTGSEKKDSNGSAVLEDGSSAVDDSDVDKVDAIEPQSERGLRKVLYTANVGDARAVLW